MIKVYKLKTIVMALLVIVLIAGFILILKNKTKSIQTSKNNSSTYKILVDVEDSKLFLLQNNKILLYFLKVILIYFSLYFDKNNYLKYFHRNLF